MTVFLLLALQAAAPSDIEIRATVRARELTVEKAGKADVEVTSDGQNLISIEGPKANGRKRISNPVIKVNIQARVADPRETAQTDQAPAE